MAKYLVLILLLGFNWATGYAIAGYCMSHGMPAQSYMFWQSFGPCVVLLISMFIKRKPIDISKNSLLYYLICGAVGVAIPSYIVYFSLQYIDMGIVILFSNCAPFIIYILAIIFGLEKFKISRMLAVSIAVIAIISIVFNNNLDNLWLNLGHSNRLWLSVLFIVPLCYSSMAVFIDKLPTAKASYWAKSVGMLFIASITFLPLAIKHGIYLPNIHDDKTWLLLIEIIITAIDSVLLFYIINNAGAVYYSLVNTITAITGIGYNYMLYHRVYSSSVFIAIGIIICCITLLSLIKSSRK